MKNHQQQPDQQPEDTNRNGLDDSGHRAEDEDGTTRAVRDEVEHSAVLATKAQAVILKDGHIVDLDDAYSAGAAACHDESQPDSDRYGHPAHCPPNVLDPLPPGACGRDEAPRGASDA